MLTKREFTQMYDQAVITIRQVKSSNDNFNKNIGVTSELSLLHELQVDEENMSHLYDKINELIEKMEQSYLDPDTARKIGTVKQQFRIQKDRRNQISKSIQQATKNMPMIPKENKSPKQKKSARIPMQMIEEKPKMSKISQYTDLQTDESNISQNQQMVEINDFDYEMERKLIHQKNDVMGRTQQKLVYVNQLALETSNMVYNQGQKLDIIGDQVFDSYKNLSIANQQLEAANKNHRKGRKKYIILTLLLIIAIGIILSFVFL